MKKITVLDLFCGAGGFSEGFRQCGFKITHGIDSWEPAIKTFNHNFSLNCHAQDILEFEESIEKLEELPITDVIIGSPSCISFSNSNRSGKADKSMGLRLSEVFFRIIAFMKYRPNSQLKAWFMENVPNTAAYLKSQYSFADLGLGKWALANGFHHNNIAILLDGDRIIVDSSDFGTPQIRKRLITGEVTRYKKLIPPTKTHSYSTASSNLLPSPTVAKIRKGLPMPNLSRATGKLRDPLYPDIIIDKKDLTDHFYDSGLYAVQWENSYFMKRNHPYMGKMYFPERQERPSRTITAVNIGTSREAIIFASEYQRKGDGQYRVPTVRELACLMGFPLTYQFLGVGESAKSRLIGNAVCPSVSRALANTVRKSLGVQSVNKPRIDSSVNTENVINLNTFKEAEFKKTPQKKSGSRFRRHPFKDGNITVTLSNYSIERPSKSGNKWHTSIQYGNGNGFPHFDISSDIFLKIEPLILKTEKGTEFVDIITNGFSEQISSSKELQELYEFQKSNSKKLSPIDLIHNVRDIINDLGIDKEIFDQRKHTIFRHKKCVPLKQLYALYAISRISHITNSY